MIHILKNPIRHYDWGSFSAIPSLLGEPPSGKPCAELWMGAHPDSPSAIEDNGESISLVDWIAQNPEAILGKTCVRNFGSTLPFLFKVLAADKPLSIQAHPDRVLAREGFERENRLMIPMNAPNRNYKDSNHKPECICALTPFLAMKGFRPIPVILSYIEMLGLDTLKPERDELQNAPNSEGLRRFFRAVMTLEYTRRIEAIQETLSRVSNRLDHDPIFKQVLALHHYYPDDIGILSPVLLNVVRLEPGQAMFLPAGELHSYLEGVGIELMANSDNVLRGGLTPKHVDVQELLNVLNFEPQPVHILTSRPISDYESLYDTPAEEFALSVVRLQGIEAHFPCQGIEMLICTEGDAVIQDAQQTLTVGKGKSVVVPACTGEYWVNGSAVLYKASCRV